MIPQFASKSITAFAVILLLSVPATAQDKTPPVHANPTPGCSASPADLEANKKVAMDFFRASGQAKVAFLDPAYKQHNPVVVRRANQENLSDYEEARNAFPCPSQRPRARPRTRTHSAGKPF